MDGDRIVSSYILDSSQINRVKDISDLTEAVKVLTEENANLKNKNAELCTLLNTPQHLDFLEAVKAEIGHQGQEWRQREYRDSMKTPNDWLAVAYFLADKICAALEAGDLKKATHHCISTSALLGHWHQHIQEQHSLESENE